MQNTENTIMLVVIDKMKEAQQSIINGADKKEYVMNKIKEYMDKESYDRYEPLISMAVDLIKKIAVDKKLLDGLHNSKCFKSMFNCIEK